MYTTKQFDKDVEELRRLIKMCDELIERQDRHTETLIQQFNGGKQMNKFYIVEGIEFDPKFKNEEEIKDLKWKQENGLGVWTAEGKNEDERISKLFDKVQDYMGVYLTSLSYCENRPHPLTSFKQTI